MTPDIDRLEEHNRGERDEREHVDANWVDQTLYTHYDPPSEPDLKEAYDEGWYNAENQGG